MAREADPRNEDTDGDGVPDADENAGTVTSYADGVLTITLFDGGELAGAVDEDTRITCGSADDAAAKPSAHDPDDDEDDRGGDQGDRGGHDHRDCDDEECDDTALVAGAAVEEATLKITSTGRVWADVDLRYVPDGPRGAARRPSALHERFRNAGWGEPHPVWRVRLRGVAPWAKYGLVPWRSPRPLQPPPPARGWNEFLYVALGAPIGLAWLILLVTLLAVGVSLAIVTIGLPLLAFTLLLWRWGADTERERAALVLGAPIARARAGCSPPGAAAGPRGAPACATARPGATSATCCCSARSGILAGTIVDRALVGGVRRAARARLRALRARRLAARRPRHGLVDRRRGRQRARRRRRRARHARRWPPAAPRSPEPCSRPTTAPS